MTAPASRRPQPEAADESVDNFIVSLRNLRKIRQPDRGTRSAGLLPLTAKRRRQTRQIQLAHGRLAQGQQSLRNQRRPASIETAYFFILLATNGRERGT